MQQAGHVIARGHEGKLRQARRVRRWTALLLSFAALGAGCSSGARTTPAVNDGQPWSEVSAQPSAIRKPETPVEILRNLKLAIDTDLLSSDKNYTTAFMSQLFGGDGFVWVRTDPQSIYGYVQSYAAMLPPKLRGGMVRESIHLDFSQSLIDSRSMRIVVRVELDAGSGASFDEVENIFGKQWRLSRRWRSPHQILLPPQAPAANKRIEYYAKDVGADIFIEYGPTGEVSSLSLSKVLRRSS